MNVIKASAEIENKEIFKGMEERIERVGRTCYKSEGLIAPGSAKELIRKFIILGHDAMLEHGGMITVRFVVDRGISHEIVRHRIASYAQESTRYCNYANDKFGGNLTFIKPCFWEDGSPQIRTWEKAMELAEKQYFKLLQDGATPQMARSILPTSLKTEIVMSANPREWRAFFRLRTSCAAHPQMTEVTRPLLEKFKQYAPILFGDLA